MRAQVLPAVIALSVSVLCPHADAYFQILWDDFNSENGGNALLNYNSFANWTVSDGTVDLIGNGKYDFYPGNGLYVDLDGSTRNPGVLATKSAFTFNNTNIYRLSFNLGGSTNASRSPLDSVTVKVGLGTFAEVFTLPWNAGFTSVSRDFQLSATETGPVRLSFENNGADNVGLILDNVSLTDEGPAHADATPELSSTALLLLGLLPAGIALRRRAVRARD